MQRQWWKHIRYKSLKHSEHISTIGNNINPTETYIIYALKSSVINYKWNSTLPAIMQKWLYTNNIKNENNLQQLLQTR